LLGRGIVLRLNIMTQLMCHPMMLRYVVHFDTVGLAEDNAWSIIMFVACRALQHLAQLSTYAPTTATTFVAGLINGKTTSWYASNAMHMQNQN
jgi:hypothetical protein